MRQIKFRAKKVGDKKWVFGFLVNNFIYNNDHESTLIFPNTIGQFTLFFDKNDEEIYEGDIVVNYKIIKNEKTNEYFIKENKGEIVYMNNGFYFKCNNEYKPLHNVVHDLPFYEEKIENCVNKNDYSYLTEFDLNTVKVIGNVYDKKNQ